MSTSTVSRSIVTDTLSEDMPAWAENLKAQWSSPPTGSSTGATSAWATDLRRTIKDMRQTLDLAEAILKDDVYEAMTK